MALLGVVLYLVAAALVAGAVWALRSGQRAALRTRVSSRFADLSTFPLEARPGARPLRGTPIDRWLWRGGIHLTVARVAALAGGLVFLVALAWMGGGPMAALTTLLALVTAAALWPHLQYRRRSAAMVAQIPLFLDQVVRGLATGRNLDGALRMATEETRQPLREVMTRVQQATDLGEDISEALRDAAHLYDLREMHFVATAVHIAHGYGSSPKEMLESASKLVRHREQAQRELRALTGETRVSAWLLSILPSALAMYMVAVNPDYIGAMWHDATGHIVLLMALSLQATGVLILWRMVKSV
ncbi:MAG TPA: type II secretion system F family protein [Rhodocyclaceae bacterium]|nr:type II secretion system F family protein [Rhodocyclaceae bacterium]